MFETAAGGIGRVVAWLVLAIGAGLLVVVALGQRRQSRRMDRLDERLERVETRARAEGPADAAETEDARASLSPGQEPPPGDVLAGWTTHVRQVVEAEGTEASGLADQAILGIHRRLHANLTPSDLASALCVSLRTLERGLAATLDCTPSQLILAMKMREARRMLLSGHYRVGEVADRLGFSNAFHFSRRFKAYYRVAPSELRGRASVQH